MKLIIHFTFNTNNISAPFFLFLIISSLSYFFFASMSPTFYGLLLNRQAITCCFMVFSYKLYSPINWLLFELRA